MRVNNLQLTVHRRNPKGLGLSTFRVRNVLIGGFLVLLFAVVLRLVAPAPAYAACTPPGAGWTCTESRTPIYGTCCGEICYGPTTETYCRVVGGCFSCGGTPYCLACNSCGYTYRCIISWKYTCVCLPPAGCNGTPCPAGFDCISGRCVPTGGNGPDPGCPASCGSKSDCNPCGSGWDCIGGSCQPQCSQTGSGTKCSPDQPNNGCPSGESCCWGVGECYLFCCGGGGHTPRNPEGKMTLSPQINDPDSSQYFFTKTGLGYKDYFYRRGYDPGLANQGKATVCVTAESIAVPPEAYSCDFGRGMAAWAERWFEPNYGCKIYKKERYDDENDRWDREGLIGDFSPGGAQYNKYGGGNFIMLRPARDDCKPGEDDYPCKISVRFRAPPNQILRAVEFDYDNNVPSAFFGFARYSFSRDIRGYCPEYTEVPRGRIPKGTGHKIIRMPATKDAWLVLDATGWNQPYWAYRAIIYNIKLHLINVNETGKADVDVVSNVVEPSVAGEYSHMDRVRFSNECPLGPENTRKGGCCAGQRCWSGWVFLDQLDPEGRWVYPWTLGNPTKTVWMHACNIHDLCTVFSDSINYNPYGTVSGYIWNDLNNNDGTGKDPSTEPNYTASTVTVSYSCPSKSRSKETSDGSYTFSNVPAGESCSISISGLASGWTITPSCKQTGKCNSPQTFTVSAGGTVTANFGVWDNPDAWFQGCNGDAYGLGVSVPVPYDSKGSCDRWFLGADPNNTAGGVVISGNATLSCGSPSRCSERGLPPGWNVRNQAIDWPGSLSFSPPSEATTISSADPTLVRGKSYVWNRSDVSTGTHTYSVQGGGIAILYVNGNFTINGKFNSNSLETQGVVIVVNGNVTINRDTVGDPFDTANGGTGDIDAVIIASGTISVTGNSTKNRLVVNGMLYGRNGISVTGEELDDNLYPRLQTIYNPLYFAPSNPLAKNSIIWREVTP